MNIDELMKAQRAEPFKPYTIHIADGTTIEVEHPEFVARSPTGRTIIVFEPDGGWRVIDLLLVSQLQFSANGHSKKRRNGRR